MGTQHPSTFLLLSYNNPQLLCNSQHMVIFSKYFSTYFSGISCLGRSYWRPKCGNFWRDCPSSYYGTYFISLPNISNYKLTALVQFRLLNVVLPHAISLDLTMGFPRRKWHGLERYSLKLHWPGFRFQPHPPLFPYSFP